MRLATTANLLVVLLATWAQPSRACTNFLITKGATVDGSTMITYAADSHELYGELYRFPAAKYPAGAKHDVYEWDTGKFLGQIDEARETYSVIGSMNEYQVVIAESTFGGREDLPDPEATVDYGSLMWLGLQRSKTAREAIEVMTGLVEKYGYASEGESFSIADPNEVWLLEMVGKGPGSKGAVWVARLIPDGYISGHANASRIRQFPQNSPRDTLFAKDVITFARAKGWFKGKDADFSFADTYAPTDFGARRFCDSRVWCMFTRAAPSQKLPESWAVGADDKATPIPLWIKPDRKLTVGDVMGFMRDHFEGTPLDMTKDVGAGPSKLPYRWRPLTWKVGDDKEEHFNERAVSTQQTGFSFVSQSRAWLPGPIGGVLWFGVDDTYSTVYFPVYAGSTQAPKSYAVGTGDFQHVTWDSAFWVFNQVSNFAYVRYDEMILEIQKEQRALESKFQAEIADVDAAALVLHKQSPRLAKEYLTKYTNDSGEEVVARWRELEKHLLYKFLDGNLKDEHGKVTHPGYDEKWRKEVISNTGGKLKARKTEWELTQEKAQQEKAKATGEAIISVLSARGVALDAKTRETLAKTDDVKKLEGWLVKAATAKLAGDAVELAK